VKIKENVFEMKMKRKKKVSKKKNHHIKRKGESGRESMSFVM
jgi:hypothetical protein